MKEEILKNFDNPAFLEKNYRKNKSEFKSAFLELYPEVKGTPVADAWYERLSYESDQINWGSKREMLIILALSILAAIIAKLPAILGINEEVFYHSNIGFIVFPGLAFYFARKNNLPVKQIIITSVLMLAGLLFINLLPDTQKDIYNLSCIHLILFLWVITGFTFVGGSVADTGRRVGYLKFNGDLLVMSALIFIAGAIMSVMTVGLFELIGMNIAELYLQNIAIGGAAAIPVIATYLTENNPQLVGKVSPVIAGIFTPLVLVMLVVFLSVMIISGKNPYDDRDFLMVFNMLLVGVMALIFFSVSEMSLKKLNKTRVWILLMLSVVTIVVNSIALSAILFRISQWGISPNRAAVLGANVLVLINLVLVSVQLLRVVMGKGDISFTGRSVARFLPVYAIWVTIVTFIFPLIWNAAF